jgi:hypothetical protein
MNLEDVKKINHVCDLCKLTGASKIKLRTDRTPRDLRN